MWPDFITKILFTNVMMKVTGPHGVVYTAEGKPAAYQDISVPLFVQGNLITMYTQDSGVKHKMGDHLKDLMADAEMYRWEKMHAFHGVWMNQIDQGQYTWQDDDEKLKFRWALVWHNSLSSPPARGATRMSPRSGQC